MASESSKWFDFASDDILKQSNSDSAITTKQEFTKSRHDSDDQEVIILAVESCMKKHTDNMMRFLEGLGSRLSRVELCCYNLDKSIGEMRSDLIRDHGEADSKLKFLEKHLQDVHRSLQIWMIDLQVADTEKELAKLQLAQNESSSSHSSQQADDRSSTPAPTQYQQSQMQPQPLQQQWKWTMQAQPPPTTSMQSPQVYLQTKPPVNHPSPEPLLNSSPMQMTSYSTIPPPGSNHLMTYSYGGPPMRTAQPLPPPPQFGTRPGDGYVSPNPYMVYDNAAVQQPSTRRDHHPYNEVVDKLVSMGYQGDHVVGVIQRLDETGQIVDFNAVLDRLNGVGSKRGWPGYI